MPSKRSWTDEQLIAAVGVSKSLRNVIKQLNLIPTGGNYDQVKKRIKLLSINTDHFTGMVWNKGLTYQLKTTPNIKDLLINDIDIQSYKLKLRLFSSGLKVPECEICGWHSVSQDGRIPVELDHINGNKRDNRIDNLRILCPNCHSLQPTHRGKNKKTSLLYKS